MKLFRNLLTKVHNIFRKKDFNIQVLEKGKDGKYKLKSVKFNINE